MLDLAAARVLVRSGLLKPARPDQLLGIALAFARWGTTPATGYAAGAARHPRRPAVVDDDGVLSWRDVDTRTDRIAGELRARGVQEGDAVGLLARNGRGFVEAAAALSKCGADVLYLNTGSAGGQIDEVLTREKATAVVHDADFASLLAQASDRRLELTTEELSALAGEPGPGAPPKPAHTSRQVILTSGTTGAPRGAARDGGGIGDLVSALDRIPLRTDETTVIAAPVFHAWGLGHLSLAMILGSTVVLRRRFDPAQVLADIQQHKATALVVVPVMLEKLLEADPSTYDLSSLRVIASSGSALPGELARKTLETFGPVLYNLYGSTEVAYAAIATPEDLAADPRTAGRPPHGVTLRVVGEDDQDVPAGEPGRIFVGSGLAFAGYTDGSDKDRLGSLIATGDLGVLERSGRLTVLGRTDDMVVVGGENVYVGQVEDVLLAHDAVREAAVVGVEDASYGARLVAHVVLDREVPEKELQDWVRAKLARYAVPREVVVHDELPRNTTGKIVKKDLA
ncbi:MAG: AMP-binding protein [Actinobacteria bacterium]|nr:AMP-binding protein [Actinomycetota bacterium]MCA1722253.1 AMP-binding protein [Actinomycetota bacterium]